MTHLLLALLLAGGQWPPPGVAQSGQPGVVLPQLRHEVKPAYTLEAMQRKIEGAVVLECVVDAEGRIREARVQRSLDAKYGLDEAAIAAAKQWVFSPGTKDGVPAPVAITIEMTFTLGTQPPLAWPAGFESTAAPPAAGEWIDHTAGTPGAQIRVSLPKDWTVRPAPAAALFLAQRAQSRSVWVFDIRQRDAVTLPPRSPMLAGELRQFAERMRQRNRDQGVSELAGAGQVAFANRLWIWVDTHVTSPASIANAASAMIKDFHLWTFVTSEGGREILINCSVLTPLTVSVDDAAKEVRSAQPVFGEMIRRLAISPVTSP